MVKWIVSAYMKQRLSLVFFGFIVAPLFFSHSDESYENVYQTSQHYQMNSRYRFLILTLGLHNFQEKMR